MTDRFAHLLEPLESRLFWERYWGREHLHLRRDSGGRYDNVLRLEDLDVLLQSGLLPAAFLNVMTDGVPQPVEEWSRVQDSARGTERVVQVERLLGLYAKGATLILNHAQHAVPRLGSFCRELARELGIATQANIYITPAGSRGFPLHTDDHEVFVLQVYGAKSWRLAPDIEVEVQAGDLLYLPRGLAHEAASKNAASVHVTLGIRPVYPFQLLEELASRARSHPAFQQPPAPGETPDNAEFARKFTDLLSETAAAELNERRFRTLVADQIPSWPGRFSDALALDGLTLETRVCARSGILYRTSETAKSIDVEFAGQKITVPVFLRSCLDRVLLGEEPFAVRELQGMITDSGRIELVKRFVQAGYLAIVKTP